MWRNQANSSRRSIYSALIAFTARLHKDVAMMRLNTIMEFPAEEFQGKKIHFTADLRCPTVLCAIGAKVQEKDPDIKRPFSITKQDVEASST